MNKLSNQPNSTITPGLYISPYFASLEDIICISINIFAGPEQVTIEDDKSVHGGEPREVHDGCGMQSSDGDETNQGQSGAQCQSVYKNNPDFFLRMNVEVSMASEIFAPWSPRRDCGNIR